MTCHVKGCPSPGHTPGDWEIYASDWIRMKGGPTTIAEVRVYRPSRGTAPEIHEPARDANAALIARAPALAHALAGLVEALGIYLNTEAGTPDGRTAYLVLNKFLAAAEEALRE